MRIFMVFTFIVSHHHHHHHHHSHVSLTFGSKNADYMDEACWSNAAERVTFPEDRRLEVL